MQRFFLVLSLVGGGLNAALLSVSQHEARAAETASKKACAAQAPKAQKGKASWYGKANHGKPTASGEKFDSNAATAAHPTLPLGTEIDVTNLENGKETTLTVNDRGPKTKGRVLDVSKKAAQDLGFAKDGTAQVKIDPKNKPKAAPKKDKC